VQRPQEQVEPGSHSTSLAQPLSQFALGAPPELESALPPHETVTMAGTPSAPNASNRRSPREDARFVSMVREDPIMSVSGALSVSRRGLEREP
jgi:hypothetical protein